MVGFLNWEAEMKQRGIGRRFQMLTYDGEVAERNNSDCRQQRRLNHLLRFFTSSSLLPVSFPSSPKKTQNVVLLSSSFLWLYKNVLPLSLPLQTFYPNK